MLIKNMVCSMRTRLYICVSMLLAFLSSCQQPFEADFDFTLNRDQLRFKKDTGQAYFLVYSKESWTVEFETPVTWATLSRTSGHGNKQVTVTCEKNTSVSRGVNIIVRETTGKTKTVYLSQETVVENGEYKLSDTFVPLIAKGTMISIKATTKNIPDSFFSDLTIQFEPESAAEWIREVNVTPTSLSCVVDDCPPGESREAVVGIYFPAAEWDETRCKSFLTIKQGTVTPQFILPSTCELDSLSVASISLPVQYNWSTKFYQDDISIIEFSGPEWVSVIYDSKTQSIILTPEINKSGQTRESELKCYLKDLDGNVLDESSVVLTQGDSGIDPVDAVALYSGEKYANCYLIEDTDAKVWWFDAKKVDGTLPSETMASAEVLWQNVTRAIDRVQYEEGKIYFRTVAGKSGNAVIALKSADGKICWSWHIWVAGTTVGTNTFGSYVFMDRNLGATAFDGKDARGLNYEWGRKDPFPGAVHSESTGSLERQEVVPDIITNVKQQDGMTIEWTIQNPASYVSGTDNEKNKEDWYHDGSDASVQDNTLWGDGTSKSIYDPCPYGYRVPSKGAFDVVKSFVSGKTFVKPHGATVQDSNASDAFFPLSGWWQRKHYEVELCNVGTQGRLWSSTPSAANALNGSYYSSYVFHYQQSGSSAKTEARVRRWGCNVRCVKINE